MEIEPSGLLNAAKKLDSDALTTIFDMYAPAIYNYGLGLTNNPVLADDIVGGVFTRLLEQLSEGKGPTINLKSYLFQSAYHLVVDEFRLNQKEAPIEAAMNMSGAEKSVPRQVEEMDEIEIVDKVMGKISADQRHVLILTEMEDLSLIEAADVMGKGANALKTTKSRALGNIRRHIVIDHGQISAIKEEPKKPKKYKPNTSQSRQIISSQPAF